MGILTVDQSRKCWNNIKEKETAHIIQKNELNMILPFWILDESGEKGEANVDHADYINDGFSTGVLGYLLDIFL